MDELLLLVTDRGYAANPFGDYLREIMKTEGFLGIEQAQVGSIDAPLLRRFAVVVLAECRPDAETRRTLRDYVGSGGRLLAMRPEPGLADLFGLRFERPGREAMLQYLSVDPAAEVGRGIEPTPLQYHGAADLYLRTTATVAAWLCDGLEPSDHPAVAINAVGTGLAIAFTYDLARSVALMRQGNPEWACTDDRCEDGDGFEGIRPVDSFLRRTGERWVDVERLPIPQADEQQRLLANCLMLATRDLLPLPRLWYLPDGKSAAVVMTSDGDDAGAGLFEPLASAAEEYGGRFSLYVHRLDGDPAAADVANWRSRGHEVSIHADFADIRTRPTAESFRRICADSAARFGELFGGAAGPSVRHHWLIWYGWADAAEIARDFGVRLDFNFYHGRHWVRPDGGWAQGYFTGSGLPQRFVRLDGRVIDAFQMLTTWADETQLYRQELGTEGATEVARAMLDAAERGRYSVFVANFHPGGWRRRNTEVWARRIMEEAVRRSLPVWSGEQLYDFIAARDGTTLRHLGWDGSRLTLHIESAAPAAGSLALMLPAAFAGGRHLLAVNHGGRMLSVATRVVAGQEYALVSLPPGRINLTVIYAP